MIPFKSVSVIGYGAVGSSLTDFFSHSDIELHSVWDRKPGVTLLTDAGTLKPAGKPMPGSADETGELILITVPDNAIAETDNFLSSLPGEWSGKCVAHFSGSLPAAILNKLKEKGAVTAAVHPLQTFTGTGSKAKLKGIYFTLQGDEALTGRLNRLIETMGSSAVIVDEKEKAFLHLTAVFASNYMISLLDMAKEVADAGGVANSLKLLEPILKATLQNVLNDGTELSLSGPAARGDTVTVAGHMDLLKDRDDLLSVYKLMGTRALQIAKNSGRLSDKKVQEIKQLFDQENEFKK